ncbi:hypothetical protein [Stackebrandtia nassauensis]|uniref:Uncharacterized protein n=1 Tax=Stackebrandtia nassauensis (strain DSM 44728 / CIP 108903 / NRRL B-16338 / NBRC 102104 / LLR-40K-21) TaxID=446470 RepID=D3PUM6_STANL|nr:hypothetical protein [Stackebrandtia nassauensis]ADD43039.1 hypothetical protein Snas_3375 [Stackebrandtia nassauensis DSM 44728]
MSRLVHYVGSLPPEINTSPRDGMRWIIDHSADAGLSTLPWDSDPRWIVEFLLGLAERGEALEVVQSGDWGDYDKQQRYRVKSGVKLTASHVSMRRAERIRQNLAVYRELVADDSRLDGVPFQQSLPSPLDLSLFTFGQRPVLLKHVATYADALAAEVTDLHATDGDDLVWQLEAPTVLVLLNKTPRPLRGFVARRLAAQMAGFVERLPQEARLILHLCYGNLNDRELVAPRDLAGVDVFLNALHTRLRAQNRAIPPVHVPAAYGSQPPPVRPQFYAALGSVHADWPLVAGIVDENQPDDSRKALALFEAAADRSSHAVATACGLGRHSEADARAAAALMTELSTA